MMYGLTSRPPDGNVDMANNLLQVANVLSEVLGRKITHTNVSQQELADWLTSRGVPDHTAGMLAELDIGIKNGMENRLNDTVLKVTGRPPMTYREFAEKNKDAWV